MYIFFLSYFHIALKVCVENNTPVHLTHIELCLIKIANALICLYVSNFTCQGFILPKLFFGKIIILISLRLLLLVTRAAKTPLRLRCSLMHAISTEISGTCIWATTQEIENTTGVPTKSDSDVIFCLQL